MCDIKIIVAGSRTIHDYDLVESMLNEITEGLKKTDVEIISGDCRGVDQLGARYAREKNLKLTRFPADWGTYGKAAGPIRNEEMAEYAASAKQEGILVAIWDGKSRGTRSMINLAKANFLLIYEKVIDNS